mmetsp:Transcript_58008/g.169582  ORF Transcript_58008/g.169582 Transcript_58008/m.169582 type:complete len:494 (+) Transcript_58008:52-1533(+)
MGASSDIGHLVRVYWSLFLGNSVEWYEFAVYGYLEPFLEEHFFRGSAMAAWMGFAVTFLARPLGGIVLGAVSDVLGRSAAVNLSIVGMLLGTCGQGMLPTYSSGSETLGHIGVVLLVMLRFLQGLSAAGEISTISTYITEVGPPKSLGRSISLISITCNMGFLSAKGVTYATSVLLGDEAMRSWGWRVPFIFALVPSLVAIVGRRGLPESEAFLLHKAAEGQVERGESGAGGEDAELSYEDDSDNEPMPGRRPTASLCRQLAPHRPNICIGMGGVASAAIMGYGGFVWTQSYLTKRGLSAEGRMLTGLCSRGLMILLALPVGWLTDIKGVAWVTLVGACLQAGCGLPLFKILAAYPTDPLVAVLVVGVGFALLGAIGGTVFFYYVVELFPTPVRGAAVGLSYNIGFSLFGGLAPIAAEALLKVSPLGPGWLLSFGGLVTAGTVLSSLCMQRQGVVKLAHVRQAPYFSSFGLCGGLGDGSPEDSSDDGSDDTSE